MTRDMEVVAAYHSRSHYSVSLLLEDAAEEPSSLHCHGCYHCHFFDVYVLFLRRCDPPEGLEGHVELEILGLLGAVGSC